MRLFLPLLVCWGVGVAAVYFVYEWLNAVTFGHASARDHLTGALAAGVLALVAWIAARLLREDDTAP